MPAALWKHDDDDLQEVWAEPDPDHHIVSIIQTGGYHGTLHKDGRRVFSKAIPTGGTCLVEAGVRPRAVHRGRWEILHIYVPALGIAKLAIEEGLIASPGAIEMVDPQCELDPVIARIGAEVRKEMRESAPLARLRIDALGLDLAIQLIRAWSNVARRTRVPERARPNDWRIRRAIDQLEANLADDIGLAELAAAVDLSPRHLSELFRTAFGLPPHQWLMRRRIERACEMLGDQQISVTNIAYACGFASSQHFATVFKKRLGRTPSEYRVERLE